MIADARSRRAVARQILLGHACSGELERQAVRDTLALLDAPLDPFSRATAPGHVTGSAIVLDEECTRVLVVWHATLQRWLQPGGHSEPDDASPLATAVRELAEETGVAAHRLGPGRFVHLDVHAIPARGAEPSHLHHDFRFAFTAPSSVVDVGRDLDSVAWIGIDELESGGGDASLRRAVAVALHEVR